MNSRRRSHQSDHGHLCNQLNINCYNMLPYHIQLHSVVVNGIRVDLTFHLSGVSRVLSLPLLPVDPLPDTLFSIIHYL